MRGARLVDAAGLLGVGLFAFLCSYEAGRRGFFPYDQSIVFDGAYRIVSGQVPYKDFLLWSGPIAYALQAVFFHWLGVSYGAYLVSAAVFNAAAAWLGMAVTRLLFPSSRWLACGAGIVTAIWFYPPFGTFAAEQTAFFFGLAALWLALWALRVDPGRRLAGPALAWGAGLLCTLAVLSKQHAGLYLLPLPALLFLAADGADRRRAGVRFAAFALGVAAGMLAFWGWLRLASDVDHFVRYAIAIPGELGWERIWRKGILELLKALAIGVGPRSIRPVVIGMELAALAALWRLRRAGAGARPTSGGPRLAAPLPVAACLVCVCLTHFQHLLTYTMDNESVNGLPFLGLIAATGLGLLRSAWPLRTTALATIAALALGVPSAVGLQAAFARQAHGVFAGSAFPTTMDAPGWRPLRWGQPTLLHGREVREADVAALQRELTARGRNFFIVPDFTILYGLTGRPSPQPIVTFNKGLTYPAQYDPALDAWIVRALERHKVELIVIEEVSWRHPDGGRGTLRDFPALQAHLDTRFHLADRLGIFTLYERTGERP